MSTPRHREVSINGLTRPVGPRIHGLCDVPVLEAALAVINRPALYGRTAFVRAERRMGATFAIGQAAAELSRLYDGQYVHVFTQGYRQTKALATQIAKVHIPDGDFSSQRPRRGEDVHEIDHRFITGQGNSVIVVTANRRDIPCLLGDRRPLIILYDDHSLEWRTEMMRLALDTGIPSVFVGIGESYTLDELGAKI